MSDPFRPTYFTDFYNKYPADRTSIMELNRDMWEQEEKLTYRLIRNNVTSLLPIFLYTLLRGPIPVLSKYGRFLGTHRTFRQYAYIAAIANYLALAPYYTHKSKTEAKLKEIDEHRMRTEGEYMEPSKPISYSFKHY